MAKALIIVDVQQDFCEGGALAVAGGTGVAQAITQHLREAGDSYSLVVATRDFHEATSDNGGHFASGEPDFVATWPAHCVQGTPGAAYSPELELPPAVVEVIKGMGKPAYSGFEGEVEATGESLEALLKRQGVEEVAVCGLATDYCVKATALDAARLGFPTTVLLPLTAPVGDPWAAYRELREASVHLAPQA